MTIEEKEKLKAGDHVIALRDILFDNYCESHEKGTEYIIMEDELAYYKLNFQDYNLVS